jgi:hypothetical protein
VRLFYYVIPAKAGIQFLETLDCRVKPDKDKLINIPLTYIFPASKEKIIISNVNFLSLFSRERTKVRVTLPQPVSPLSKGRLRGI